MNSKKITKEALLEWCEKNMVAHTDWTGTRVETLDRMSTVEEFVNRMYQGINSQNSYVENF